MKQFTIAVAATLAGISAATAAPTLSLVPLGTVKTGPFVAEDPRAAEINAFDPAGNRLYVVNPLLSRLDVIDASNPTDPDVDATTPFVDILATCQAAPDATCPLEPGAEPNSVAIHGDRMAVALGNAVRTDNGHVAFFELRGTQAPRFLSAVEVGALPDMVTFTADGKYALTANEGEPNQDYTIDPVGTVSIIEMSRLGTARAVRHVDFERFDNPGQRAKLEREGVRIFGPGASVAQDLEPEYIATVGKKAYVTLQENNALAIINIAGATVEKIVGLGLKDHSLEGNAMDVTNLNADGALNIRAWPVHGMFQPDAIHAVTLQGRTYLITANEGDARDYDAYSEEARVGDTGYPLDPMAFPNAIALKTTEDLRRLTVSTATGDLDGDGDFDRIDVFGARSVSILDQQGRLVWDSGEMFERIAEVNDLLLNPASPTPTLFNTTSTANSRRNRSDDKGVEPESVVVGYVNGRTYAFVGLERDGGIVVLDMSEPTAPEYVAYANNRKFPRNAAGNLLNCANAGVDCGDLGPEGLTFVPAGKSPTAKALLIVSNEVSSTTTIWEIE
jgi:DNA-binding beta-propeller fold protein YncE